MGNGPMNNRREVAAPEAKRDASASAESAGGRIHRRSTCHAAGSEHPWSAAFRRSSSEGFPIARPHRAPAPTLARMAKLGGASASAALPEGSAQIVVDGVTYAFPLAGAVDLDAERSRLSKAVAAAEKDRDALAARLGNASFTERAKPEAVEKARADHDARAGEAERLAAALARLG